MPALVHLTAALVWLVALLEAVGARWLLGEGETFLRTRDLVVAGVGAVVVGLCLSGVRRPVWPAVGLAVAGTVAVAVRSLAAPPDVVRVEFAFVAHPESHGAPALVAAVLTGLAVGLVGPALLRR